jgi:hypothetical protein
MKLTHFCLILVENNHFYVIFMILVIFALFWSKMTLFGRF